MNKIGVVFQGPLIHHGKSVFQNIENIKKYRCDLDIVVSTNEQSYKENRSVLKDLSALGVEVISHQNMEPVKDKARNHHVRNMLLGTQKGLESLDNDFVFRFRSDHNVTNIFNFQLPDPMEPPSNLEFPICVSTFGTHHRILGQLRRGCISDHVHFGNRNDLLKYWHLDGLTEELLLFKARGIQSVPTNMRYFIEQILYLAWRVRAKISDGLRLPSTLIWEEEFAKYFRLATDEVFDANLHSNLDIWRKYATRDGSFLKLSATRSHELNYKLIRFQIFDDYTRWKNYLSKPM